MTKREQSNNVMSSFGVNVRLLASMNDGVNGSGDIANRKRLYLGLFTFIVLMFTYSSMINGLEVVGRIINDTTVVVRVDVG